MFGFQQRNVHVFPQQSRCPVPTSEGDFVGGGLGRCGGLACDNHVIRGTAEASI